MKVLGLDVGEKRIGVAKADSDTKIAVPIGFLLNDGSLWQELAKMARVQGTACFVLGLPRSNEGNETKQSQYVKDFAKKLKKEIPEAKIKFQDESLTSVEAEERLKKRNKKYEKGDIDTEAATIILQDFVNSAVGKNLDTPSDDSFVTVETSETSELHNDSMSEKETSGAGKKTRPKGKLVILAVCILVVMGLVGTTAILKCRDFIRQKREEEYAKQEAEMKAAVFNFTILPGETIADIKAKLLKTNRDGKEDSEEEKIANYTVEEINVALAYDYDFDFLTEPRSAALARGDKSNYLEGYLYGETYEFYATDTVETILTKFLTGMDEIITENNLIEKYAEHGLSLYQGITLASIVQKESPAKDMNTVAQVFYSRLAYGWKLGSDVTVSYAVDRIDPERTIYGDNAAALEINSCYNTRKNVGLPCGPISNPGLAALKAVGEPSNTGYLYFLTGDDGVMYYSYTESEHNRNAAAHCKELCNISL